MEDMIEDRIFKFLDKALKESEKFKSLYSSNILFLETPKDLSYGDLSSNVSFRIAKSLRLNPDIVSKEISQLLRDKLDFPELKGAIESVEDVSGFINFRLSTACLYEVMKEIFATKEKFGRCVAGAGKSVQIEFVSANPTGTLSVAHARQAAFGDSLANILSLNGYNVSREYYINDEGVQISILGKSIHARYRQMLGMQCEFPEDGYKGDYIKDIAAVIFEKYADKFSEENAESINFFSDFGVKFLLSEIKSELSNFGVEFDCWYSQRALGESGKIEKTLKILEEKSLLYEQDGAVWFKSTAFGDDKDRVIRKSDGAYTYVTSDIAYHKDKFERGFNNVIDVLGPDHHGYVNRMKAAIQALGYDNDSLSIIIIQLATLYKDGKPVRMSTRAGEYITLRKVLDEVGKDAARFFFLMRKASAHLDFDLELAKKQTPENPVYYVQYAHARICSILALSNCQVFPDEVDLSLLRSAEELNLLRQLRQFPLSVLLSARELEPHKIVLYLQALAAAFHKFYETSKVISDDAALTRARLFLIECVRQVLHNGLSLLGVSSPSKM
ncbi:MAG: arginine--tRNA ligase [Candidatus Omnitrophota bacterium]